MKYLLSMFLGCLALGSWAQEDEPFALADDFHWGEPVYESRNSEDTSSIFFLKNKLFYHFAFSKDDDFYQDRLVYKKVYLNTPAGIEDFNKVYIPQQENETLIDFSARSINGDKVIELDEDDIQTGEDEESGRTYTYFAIQGLEIGTVVEYYYIIREKPQINGTIVEYQYDIPVEEFEWDLVAPAHLEFTAKVYNLPDSISSDSAYGDRQHLYVHRKDVPAYREESTSSSRDHYGRLIFKLDKNFYNGKRNLVSYAEFAQRLTKALHQELSRKEEKGLEKLLDQVKKNALPEMSLGENVDQYIKTHFRYIESAPPALNGIQGILEARAYSGFGGMLLYKRLLNKAGVKNQVVYTTNRARLKFDSEFEAYPFLNEVLIYLPGEDIFLDYTDMGARNGVINYMLTGNEALFIDEMNLGGNMVATREIRRIPFRDAAFSTDSTWINFTFGPDLRENAVDVTHAATGYTARSFQPLKDVIDKEEEFKEYAQFYVKYIDNEADIDTFSYRNAGGRYLGRKPFYTMGRLTSRKMVESAGPNLLFKVGELIGPQTEMYYEDSLRRFDIENDYARTYYRTLTFEQPEGYQFEGVEKLNTLMNMEVEGEEKARFESKVRREGNRYTVTVYEYYQGFSYPKEKFTDYARVINAAADFNKITLLLKKQ